MPLLDMTVHTLYFDTSIVFAFCQHLAKSPKHRCALCTIKMREQLMFADLRCDVVKQCRLRGNSAHAHIRVTLYVARSVLLLLLV